MIITEKFKKLLRLAQKDNFTTLFCVIGSYKATTYVSIYNIDSLLNENIGTSIYEKHRGRWLGCPNYRHLPINSIQYQKLFKKYKYEATND